MQLSRTDLRTIYLTRLIALLAIGTALAVGGCRKDARPADPPLVTIGRAYSASMTGSYASAWSKAASDVEAGGPVADAIASVRPSWDAARVKAFEAVVSPAFEAIVPAGTPDDAIPPDRRTALAKAMREFARGVGP